MCIIFVYLCGMGETFYFFICNCAIECTIYSIQLLRLLLEEQ